MSCNPQSFGVACKSGLPCEDCSNYPHIAKIDYECIKCGYVLENGGMMAREICPTEKDGCGALNSFVPIL